MDAFECRLHILLDVGRAAVDSQDHLEVLRAQADQMRIMGAGEVVGHDNNEASDLVLWGVGPDGFEPSTSPLSGVRSNRAELWARGRTRNLTHLPVRDGASAGRVQEGRASGAEAEPGDDVVLGPRPDHL
jgi:hypothetical protein